MPRECPGEGLLGGRELLLDMAALEVRVKTPAQNSAAIVATRMAISADEMSTGRGYDYVVVNRDLAQSVAEVEAIPQRRAPSPAPASTPLPISATACAPADRATGKQDEHRRVESDTDFVVMPILDIRDQVPASRLKRRSCNIRGCKSDNLRFGATAALKHSPGGHHLV